MKMTNQIENRILIVSSVGLTLVGVWLILKLLILPTYTAQINHLQAQNKQKDETIIELAKIARYSITNDFEKLKTQNGGSIVLDLNNELNHIEQNLVKMDSVVADPLPEKKGFFKRIFGGKKP